MKLKSKNSFLKRLSCIALSLMLCLTSFTLAGFVPTVEAEAADGDIIRSISVNGYGVVANDDKRLSGTQLNIVNDTQDENFDIGFVSFSNVSSLASDDYVISSASYTFTETMESGREALGLSFYYPTKNVDYFTGTSVSIKSGDANSAIFKGDDGFHLNRSIEYFGMKKIGSISTAAGESNVSRTVDITGLLREAVKLGLKSAKLLIVCSSAGGYRDSGGWSDTLVSVSTSNIDVTLKTNKEFVKENISNVKKSYSNISVGNADPEYLKGVVNGLSWSDPAAVKINNYDSDSSNSVSYKVHTENYAVALYTGSNSDIRFPVIFRNSDYTESGDGTIRTYISMDHLAFSNEKFSLGNDIWYRCNSYHDLTKVSDSTFNFYSYLSGNYERATEDTKNKYRSTESKSNKNYIKFTGSVNNNTYYEKLGTATFNLQADYVCNWKKGWSWSQYSTHSNIKSNLTYDMNLYVLNFEPLYNIISSQDFVSNFNTIYGNSSKYTDDSLSKYYKIMADIVTFDISLKPTSNDSDVVAIANNIKNLVTNYKLPTLKKFTVNFVNYNGQSVEKVVLNPGEKIGEFPANTAPTPDLFFPDKGHNVYYWNTSLTKDDVPTTDVTINELQGTQLIGHSSTTPATPIISQDKDKNTIHKHQKTCSICKAEYTEWHNLVYDSDKKYAKCKDCDDYHTEVDNYTFNGFRITKGNLFDFDKYASKTASTKVVENKGTSNVDIVNDTITVAASGYDVYTNHSGSDDCYTIPVIGGNTYTFSYVPSKSDNQVYVFFYNDGNQTATLGESYNYKVISEGKEPDKTGKNTDYFVNNYSAKENSESKIIFTAPANCHHVDFRFGTVQAGSICTFSEISFYESDANGNPTKGYEVLASDVESGANVLSKLNIPSANKCNASYSMTGKDGPITSSHTIDTNLNITLDTVHAYGNFTNDYTKGLAYDKNKTYTHTGSCSKCGNNDTQPCEFGGLDINGNTATLTCSECSGTYTLDLEAYKKAVADANNSVNNSAAYTSESRTDLSSVLTAQDAALSSAKTQAQIDAMTRAIEEANKLAKDNGKLVLMQYDVEFYYVLDNKPAVNCETGNATVDYGTEFELTAPTIEGNYSIIKWTRTTYPNGKPKDETVGSSNETLKGRYTGTTKYYVYLKTIPAQQESTETANIYLTDRLGRVIDAMSVNLTEGKATLDVSVIDNSIKIGNVTMTAPSISFYRVSGFRFSMNNEPVTNTRYTITDDTYISVTYTPATSFKITCDSTCKADKTEAQWDDKVTVTANNNATETTQWYVNGVLVGYGPKYVFRANQDVNITCNNESATLRPTAAVSRLSYSSPIDRTITVVGSFNLPDGYTLVETGVLLKTSAVNNTDEVSNVKNYNLKSGNAKKFVATNYTKDTHQFTVNVYSSKQYDEIYLGAVAYLTYEDANGNENTVYSPLVNTTYSNGKNTQSSISQEVA